MKKLIVSLFISFSIITLSGCGGACGTCGGGGSYAYTATTCCGSSTPW